jgi:hypothetical protein
VLKKGLAAQKRRYEELLNKEVPAFNAWLKKAKIDAVISPEIK